MNPGVVGPVLAFRGEIEAQGRGSLHPHIFVWLVGMSPYDVVQILQRDPETLQERLREWMRVLRSGIHGVDGAGLVTGSSAAIQ